MRARCTSHSHAAAGAGTYVRTTDATTNQRMNQGIATCAAFRLNSSAVASVSGTIQRARVSLIVVAICSASAPYRAAAPTTELVSWMAIADHTRTAAASD